MIIDWFTPTLNGQQLLGYTVYFRKHGGTYATELTHCDGSDPTITFYTTCTVPLSTFTASPFNLVLGEQINVQVVAYNAYGNSAISVVGGTAQIVLVPNAPVNLQNNPSVTLAT